jgi:predicted O-linked N-acetylglucosamine transferase (SPINDLY family)
VISIWRKICNDGLDKDILKILKQKLQAKKNTAPLFNTAHYTKNLEKAYQQVWHYYIKQIPHDYLDILIESKEVII